jgi:glutathione S-transferase
VIVRSTPHGRLAMSAAAIRFENARSSAGIWGGGAPAICRKVADSSILSWARPARIDLTGVPKMADWFKRCAERPAARAARDLQR